MKATGCRLEGGEEAAAALFLRLIDSAKNWKLNFRLMEPRDWVSATDGHGGAGAAAGGKGRRESRAHCPRVAHCHTARRVNPEPSARPSRVGDAGLNPRCPKSLSLSLFFRVARVYVGSGKRYLKIGRALFAKRGKRAARRKKRDNV